MKYANISPTRGSESSHFDVDTQVKKIENEKLKFDSRH